MQTTTATTTTAVRGPSGSANNARAVAPVNVLLAALLLSGCAAHASKTEARPFRAPLTFPAPNPEGRVYSISEHPYMFYGQLVSGGSPCEPSAGFTFATVKDLGREEWDCRHEVTDDPAARTTNWSTTCVLQIGGVSVAKGSLLRFSYDTQPAKDGSTMIRQTYYMYAFIDVATRAQLYDCMYTGFTIPRK